MKSFTGTLVGLIGKNVVIRIGDEERAFPRASVAQVAPVIELDEAAIDAALDGVYDQDDDYETTDEASDELFGEDDQADAQPAGEERPV